MKITESKPIPPSLSYSSTILKYRYPIKAEGITKPRDRTFTRPISLFIYVLVIFFIILLFFT